MALARAIRARQSLPLIAFSVFVLAVTWIAVAYQIARETREAEHNARVNLSNLTRAFAEHAVKTLEGADLAIRSVRDEIARQGYDFDLAAYVHRKAFIDAAYHQIAIIGADGRVRNSSLPFQRVDLSFREHFKFHQQGREDVVFVSKPVIGRVSNKPSIQVTRRIDMPDGSFGGVVVLSLSPDYLTRFYGEVDLGRQGVVSLVGYDGTVRARTAFDGPTASQEVSDSPLFQEARRERNGTTRTVGSIDRFERIWAFRSLDQYGLLTICGIGIADVMADAMQRRTLYIGSGLLMTFVVAALTIVLLRRMGQQEALMRELSRSNEKANAANLLKSRIIANVSHELRTPLNGILGYAELVKDTSTDPEAREYGQVIHDSADRLHRLVSTMLDLAAIESGNMPLKLSEVDVRRLLDEAVALNGVAAAGRGMTIALSSAPGAPRTVVTDRARLMQILDNLLSNAIKFGHPGSSIEVAARGDAQHYAVCVADQGPGIPSAELDSVFSRFRAAATAQAPHPDRGVGLGLPLARELITLLGGTIAIESWPDSGTTVTISLPVRAPGRGDGAAAEPT